MPDPCPDCQAVFDTGELCLDRFHMLLALELERPDYYAVHHLSVLCFILQHEGYAQEGWLKARKLLESFINQAWSPAQALQRFQTGEKKRSGDRRCTRSARLPTLKHIRWRSSIAAIRFDNAEHYRADVRRWAENILADTAPLIRPAEAKTI